MASRRVGSGRVVINITKLGTRCAKVIKVVLTKTREYAFDFYSIESVYVDVLGLVVTVSSSQTICTDDERKAEEKILI